MAFPGYTYLGNKKCIYTLSYLPAKLELVVTERRYRLGPSTIEKIMRISRNHPDILKDAAERNEKRRHKITTSFATKTKPSSTEF